MKYLVREVGWVFNDSTFDNDGHYRTVEIFDSEIQAKAKKEELEFEYFLHRLEFIHRYESYGNYKENFRNYKSKITKCLVQEFNLNPTIQLMGHYGYSSFMFLQELNPGDVQKLLEVMNIDFFSIVEIEDSKQLQYEAKLNPIYYEGREEYLWDYHGTNRLRFDTKLEAFKRFIKEEYHFYHFTFNKNPKLAGTLNEISELPDVLNTLIQSTTELEYLNEELILLRESSPNIILQLNELLKEPILLFDEVEINKSKNKFDSDFTSIRNQNKEEKSIIYNQSYKSLEDEEFYLTKEYLIHYSFGLSMDDSFFNYKKIIEDYINKRTETQLSYKYGHLYYGESMIQFHGVIKSLVKKDGKNLVEGCFGYGADQIADISKTAYGCHEDLEIAFDESLEKWLELFGEEYIEYLSK